MSADQNKALVKRLYQELLTKNNTQVVDELVAGNYVDHYAPPGLPAGPDGLKALAAMYGSAFPGMKLTFEDQIADGDRVVSRWRVQGTHQGELMGIPPTGKQVNITGIAIDRIAGGKVAEHWEIFDQLGMLQQLGVVPAPEQG